ncbi:CBS domain-containing protein [Botrimarina hoheduenensis]|uniref:Inosine-5'-monophosphate dehydrogenase n=1 Tax=Botrimarina hoheduenensis TaxID=2528000 RepID=A0A5C5WAM4_9BACT|nr:CBS domain-containing protein [Botrimarina hoheduenensis]TWT47624.1 Inosine-5'-monophosphate dehydrogenase [Botrimarina hoheduenensis]
MHTVLARDFMVTKLVTLRPEMDVHQAIELLLRRRISGAPVVDPDYKYLGIFSERCSMQVMLDSAYEQLPSSDVGAFMDREALTITPETQLLSIAQAFLLTSYRRLPVIDDEGLLLGQISRRDVIRAAMKEMQTPPTRQRSLLYLSALMAREDAPIS